MCPCTASSGWYVSITFRTAVEPTGPRRTSPAETVGRRFSSRIGAVSRPESCGGTWIMKTARRGSRTWLGERREPVVQLVLRLLARRLPRRDVRPAGGEQLESAGDVEHLPVRVDGRVAVAVEHRIDAEVVVVSRHQIQRHLGVREPLRRQLEPRRHPLVHQPVQQRVAAGLVAGQPLRLVRRRDEGVVADVGDVALELRQLLVAARRPLHAEQLGLVAAVALEDRHDRLPGQVAGDERDVGLVDVQLDRVDELPPRLLGGVEVARDIQPRCDAREL